MSKQEMYAWTSLLSSLAILAFYFLNTIGLPENWSEIEGQLTSFFFKIFLFVLLVEVALGVLKRKNEVEKDERDEKIAGKGFRNGYYVLAVSVVFIIFQIVQESFLGFVPFMQGTLSTVHLLVITLFLSSLTNRVTQIYLYRTM